MRCHDSRFGATEFNPGLGRGRFHPFAVDGSAQAVPTLYGASDLDGALAETVFHDVPLRGGLRAVGRSTLRPLLASVIAAKRPLRFAQLHGFGLTRLGVSRGALIDSEAGCYPRTIAWAAALYAHAARFDGLVWISRLHDTSRAVVLFGDRVERGDLRVVKAPLALFLGPGFERALDAAEKAGIAIVE